MASVFKRGRVWYARYRDENGRERKVAGFTDKGATIQLAARKEHEAELIRTGLMEAPKPERTIQEDLDAFRLSLEHKEVSGPQIELVAGRCQKILTGCDVSRVSEIDGARVEAWLAAQRKGGSSKGKGLSVQTSNHYLRAVKQFTRWLHRQKKLKADPLTHLDLLNVDVDRRHDRRALSDQEVEQLLAATQAGRKLLKMAPLDRYMLYVFALSTGLRASELASLKPESLSLESNPPTVKVKAGYSKRRRQDVLPLPADLLSHAKDWLAEKKNGMPLWPGTWAKNRYAGRMLRADLEAAGIEYQDAEGLFADFHSLRHTYISNLARSGVPLATAQKLARHSTPVLTAARYTHLDLTHQSQEVDKLPRLGRNLGRIGGTICRGVASSGSEPAQDSSEESGDPARQFAGNQVNESGE